MGQIEIHKILVVEDNMIIQMYLSRTVKDCGFEVVGEARDCDKALELIEQEQPDLIIMDLGLVGDKDGIETAKIVNRTYNIPIIFITGNSDDHTIERAKKVNPYDIIIKPIDEDRLISILLQFKNSGNNPAKQND